MLEDLFDPESIRDIELAHLTVERDFKEQDEDPNILDLMDPPEFNFPL